MLWPPALLVAACVGDCCLSLLLKRGSHVQEEPSAEAARQGLLTRLGCRHLDRGLELRRDGGACSDLKGSEATGAEEEGKGGGEGGKDSEIAHREQ